MKNCQINPREPLLSVLLGYKEYNNKKLFDPSLMAHFRKCLSIEQPYKTTRAN
jgi:hypothetical protein